MGGGVKLDMAKHAVKRWVNSLFRFLTDAPTPTEDLRNASPPLLH
jgi:hypothetical protein